MFKLCLLSILFTSGKLAAHAQELTNLNLGIERYSGQLNNSLFVQLRSAQKDTDKARLLLKICSYYTYQNRNYDSLLYYANLAKELSQYFKFDAGYYESCFLLCKIQASKGNITEAKSFIPLVSKPQQARLLLVLAEHYLFRPNQQKKNLDSSYFFLKSALSLSESLQSQHWKQETLIALGKYYFSKGEFINGKESFLKVIRYYQQTGDKLQEARWWNDLALHMPDTDSTYHYEIDSYKNALRLYGILKDNLNQAEVLYDLAGLQRNHAKYDTATYLFLQAIALLDSAGVQKKYKFYSNLSTLYQQKGNLEGALNYSLMALKNIELIGDTSRINSVYFSLGEIYASLNKPVNSLHYYLLAKNKIDERFIYNLSAKAATQLIKLQKPREALQLIIDLEKNNPPVRMFDKETLYGIKGDCYYALRNDELAEKYYLEMIRTDEAVQLNKSKEMFPYQSISGSTAYYKIGRFYVDKQQYKVADTYISRAFTHASFNDNTSYSTELFRDILFMQFKIDSATGNYVSSIKKLQQYTAINDSIFNAGRIKEVEKLNVAFETAKKEKDIELLQKETLLQQKQLMQSRQFRSFSIVSIIFMIVLVGLIFNRSRLKQKSNLILQAKQAEISKKNTVLQRLVEEKEWLLKEVHHRVKNNLQTVVSLLELQSENLNDEALSAIHDSQNRIYAMSLIHQKLYQSDNVASINMACYLQELIGHLREIYNVGPAINIQYDVVAVEMDVSQAIPVGLIVNEAVTNSIKYAFTKAVKNPEIIISLNKNVVDQFVLTIADNGTGLPANFNMADKGGLGFKLMNGLAEDIEGSLKIESTDGTRISVYFHASTPLYETDKIKNYEKIVAT